MKRDVMSSRFERVTLADYIGMSKIKSMIQKRRFGGYEIPAMSFLTMGLWLFLSGAIFGRARRDKLEVVAKMFVELETVANAFARVGLPRQDASNEDWVFYYISKLASDGMTYYRNYCKKEPESFLDLWLTSFSPPDLDFRDLDKMKKLARKKIRLDLALYQADGWLLAGISYGSTFPDLTEKMWKQEYETEYKTKDPEFYNFMTKCMGHIPEKSTLISLKEMEQLVLSEVTSYVKIYFPELVDPLSLRLR